MSTYLFISAYILSLLAALVLFITGKNRSRSGIRAVVVLHLACALWFLIVFIRTPDDPGYSFLAVLCSGLLGAGWLLRTAAVPALRIYFSLYLLTLLFFAWSPSRFTSFLIHADLADRSPRHYRLHSNYFLEQQRSLEQPPRFKVVRQFGLFHKTLRRNIELPAVPDSVSAGSPDASGRLRVRVYFHAGDTSGTVDLELSLAAETADSAASPMKR